MILQIINSLRSAGAERFVVEIASEMKRKGHEVEVMVFDRTDTVLARELAEQGITIRHTLSPKYLSPLNLFTFLRIMFSRRYEVIHTHLTYAQLWVALASLCNIHRKKLFTTEHNAWNRRRERKSLRYVDKFIYSRFRHIFCISSTTLQTLLEWINPRNRNKYSVGPNCVDPVKFGNASPIARAELGLETGDTVIMMIGRMASTKDQATLIRAVERLPRHYKCVLVGEGETMEEVRKSVTDPCHTIFMGHRSDIPALLQICDIYVQSSHWEGMPTAILEAMASGKPVAGSDVPGVRDLLPADQLFGEGDDRALAELIATLTPERKANIISRQNKTVQNFSVSKIVDDLLKYYAR